MKVVWSSKYKTVSVYVVITATIILLIALFVFNLPVVGGAIGKFFSILTPFVIGLAAAYLLSRPAVFIEKRWFAFVEQRRPHPGIRRGLAIFTLFVIVFGIFVLLIYFILPQLFDSVGLLFRNLPGYLDQLNQWITDGLKSADLHTPEISGQLNRLESDFLDFSNVLRQLVNRLPNVISSVGTGLFNFFVGMISCVYMLYSRERFRRQAKKLIFAVLKPGFAKKFIDILKYSNNVLLGYIMGTLISTAFVGVSTFVFMMLLHMPYAVLITVMIAVTNVIPFFGPFLGAIPSAIILLMVNPLDALIFVIFIIALQQIDGGIVMPKLVGMEVGLSAFWVLFALILGGGLFGFWGLVLCVPVFAVVYSLIAALVNSSLVKKGILPKEYSFPKDVVPVDTRTSGQKREAWLQKRRGKAGTRKAKK